MENTRLLTKQELDKAIGNRRVESLHLVFPAIEAQDAKTTPIVRRETALQIFKEIEVWFSATDEAGRGRVNSIDTKDWQTLKDRWCDRSTRKGGER